MPEVVITERKSFSRLSMCTETVVVVSQARCQEKTGFPLSLAGKYCAGCFHFLRSISFDCCMGVVRRRTAAESQDFRKSTRAAELFIPPEEVKAALEKRRGYDPGTLDSVVCHKFAAAKILGRADKLHLQGIGAGMCGHEQVKLR